MTSTGIQESDETYLLTVAGGSAKVRDDLMDVKLLRETDADGLERWEPVMKASFPMSPDDVATVLEALGLGRPTIDRDRYTLDEFVAAFGGGGAIRAVQVHKRRVRYKVNGCTSEVTDVVADGKPSKTVAIESEDKAAVLEAVRQTGLVGLPEHELPEGARRRWSTDRPERYAVIDVGTNSVKFHVAERDGDGRGAPSSTGPTSPGSARASRRPARSRRPRSSGPSTAITGMVDEAKRDDAGRDRRRRHGRAADGEQRGRRARGGQGRDRRHDRRDLRRGREPARLSRAPCRASAPATARRSCSTRAAAAPSSPSARARASTSGSASTSAPSATPTGSAWTVRSGRDVVDEALAAIAADLVAARRPPDAGRGRRDGRRR